MSGEVDTSYGPYASDPAYVELNHRLVDAVRWSGVTDIIDVACGAGTIGALAWRALTTAGRADPASMIGVDVADDMLALAAERWAADVQLAAALADGRIRLVRASGDALPVPDAAADVILMGNAIHLFPNKEALLAEVARVLRRGGTFAFNTAFYAGTFVDGTEPFYRAWLREALVRARTSQGARRSTRSRVPGDRAFARRWATVNEFGALLERAGFDLRSVQERLLRFTRTSLESLAAYAGLANVLMSGYPEDVACTALTAAVAPAMRAAGVMEIPRGWLEIAAVKR